MKKKYIEMSIEEVKKEIKFIRSDCFLFLFIFTVTFFIGVFFLALYNNIIGSLSIFMSILSLIMVTTGINIKNHLSLLLYLKTREATR